MNIPTYIIWQQNSVVSFLAAQPNNKARFLFLTRFYSFTLTRSSTHLIYSVAKTRRTKLLKHIQRDLDVNNVYFIALLVTLDLVSYILSPVETMLLY